MIVYAFEWCDCIHESAFKTMTLHTTKAGAYRAMRQELLRRWAEETEHKHNTTKEWVRAFNRFKPLENERWKIVVREVFSAAGEK